MLACLAATTALLLSSDATPAPPSARTVPFHHETHFRFATVAEAESALGRADAWVRALSPFDRQLRLDAPEPVDKEAFLDFVRGQARGWDAATMEALTAAIDRVGARLTTLGLRLDLPDEIMLVRTTGREEGGAGAYTREHTIFMAPGRMPPDGADRLLLHELFHVMTRHDPRIRKPLYAIVGFEPCPELTYPAALLPRKITNPDAYHFDAAVEVTVDGAPVRAIPLTLARALPYRGGGLFRNVSVEFLVVDVEDGVTTARMRDGAPVLHPLPRIEGYWEKIGRNTQYLIHPEEIMADNFALAITGEHDVPNPGILDAVLMVLPKDR
jgi:hypothetical protein